MWTNLEMKGVNIYGGLPVLGNTMDALCRQSRLILTTFHRTVEANELSPVTQLVTVKPLFEPSSG